MALTGPLSPNGKQALLGMKIWEEHTNKAGGLLGRPVKLDLLRRSVEPRDRARHLHQAARRRQSRPDRRRLCHQSCTRQRCRSRSARARPTSACSRWVVNSEFHYPKYFSDDPERTGSEAGLHRRLLQGRGGAKSQAEDRGAGRRRRGVLQERLRRRPRERQEVRPARSSTTAPIRRRPPTSRRSCARSRPAMPRSSACARIRSTRSAWCWPRTRPA